MVISFVVSTLMVYTSFFALFKIVTLDLWSLAPAILLLVSLLQALIFKSYANDREDNLPSDNTAYSLAEIDKKSYRLGMKWHYRCKIAIIPILLLLIIFFPPLYKVIVSVSVYVLSYLPVKLFVRLEKNKTEQ